MKNLILLAAFAYCFPLLAQIVPKPQTFSREKGVSLTQLKVAKSDIPALQKSLETSEHITIAAPEDADLEIRIKTPLRKLPAFKNDESYSIRSQKNKLIIEAPTEFGALYALESLKQLFLIEGGIPGNLKITDAPRFPWRGLLIDVARNWIDLETLKTQITLMSTVKLNVLHLHLSDDQAFRLESKTYPKLHQNNWDGKFFTQVQMRELVEFAAEKGIRVVPEFDVPGHTSSIISAYPELAAKQTLTRPSQKYGPHDEAMNPIDERTYTFLENLFQEMTQLFPDEFFHVGGDEVTGKHWLGNPEIVKYMKDHNIQDTTELQFRFTRRMEALIQKLGKKMIAWDEVLKEKESLAAVAQIWRGPSFANQAITQKMPVLFSYGYYLDLQLASQRHYLIDPAREMGLKSDPALLWGGEACMWSERITNETTTHRIWPRVIAVAERLWSARSTVDVEDFYHRQAQLSKHLGFKDFDLQERISQAARLWQVSPETLSDFFSWLEPGKFYSQHRYREITTKTPWNMWVDVMPSESLKATKLNWVYEKWLSSKDPESLKELEQTIASLNELSLKLTGEHKIDFPEKAELLALAKDFAPLSRIATDALKYLKTGERPGSLWFLENQTKLGMIGQVRSGMRPAFHRVVEKMVFRVAHKNNQLY